MHTHMPTPFVTPALRHQFVMREDFLRLTDDASLRKNADGDVLLECDWQTYHPWEYLSDDQMRSASHPTWPAARWRKCSSLNACIRSMVTTDPNGTNSRWYSCVA